MTQAISKLLMPASIARFGRLDIERDFIFVEDVAWAFLAAAHFLTRGGSYEVFNIGSGSSVPVGKIIEHLQSLLKIDKALAFEHTTGEMVPDHHRADIRRATELLGWRPTVNLIEGLALTVQALRSTEAQAPSGS